MIHGGRVVLPLPFSFNYGPIWPVGNNCGAVTEACPELVEGSPSNNFFTGASHV